MIATNENKIWGLGIRLQERGEGPLSAIPIGLLHLHAGRFHLVQYPQRGPKAHQ